MRGRPFIWCLAIGLSLLAPTSADAGERGKAARAPKMWEDEIRNQNREHLNKLSVGMLKSEVLEVMGITTIICRDTDEPVSHPFRTETLISQDGKTTLEILFYWTDLKRRDGAITDDELTPLVLKEGKLIGWGQSFLNQSLTIYEIRIR